MSAVVRVNARNMSVSAISPEGNFSSGSLVYVPSSHVSSDGVAEPAGWFVNWKRRRSGLQMCPGKRQLSKRFAVDVDRTSAAVAAAAIVNRGASGEDRGSFLHESNTIKTFLMPEMRMRICCLELLS